MRLKFIRVFGWTTIHAKALEWPSGRDVSSSIPYTYRVLLWLPWFFPWIVNTFAFNAEGKHYVVNGEVARERWLVIKVP